MRIRQKYYPYPVMDRGNHSYKEFSFNVVTTAKREGYNIVFEFEASIGDAKITELLLAGQVVFAYHIQCAQTCYRAAFETSNFKFTKPIREDLLNGLVEICPFIIAKEDLKAFKSENFSSDYTGFAFDIDKGGILAIGDQSHHDINKDLEDLNNTSSIFMVTANPASNAENMSVDIRDKKIYVVLPKEQYGIYRSISKNSTTQKTMHAMVFVPALMSVLMELKIRLERSGYFEEYSECRWLRSIENVSEKRFSKTLEDLLKTKEPIELAQELLKNPMNDAFDIYRS